MTWILGITAFLIAGSIACYYKFKAPMSTDNETVIPLQTPPQPIPSPTQQDMADRMVLGIKQFEGWWKASETTPDGVYHATASTSYANCNPGNIRCRPNSINALAIGCSPGHFCIFKDEATGILAQRIGLLNVAKGQAVEYGYYPEMTLPQFFDRRDPPADNNNPEKYADFMAAWMGVDIAVWQMKDLLN